MGWLAKLFGKKDEPKKEEQTAPAENTENTDNSQTEETNDSNSEQSQQ